MLQNFVIGFFLAGIVLIFAAAIKIDVSYKQEFCGQIISLTEKMSVLDYWRLKHKPGFKEH